MLEPGKDGLMQKRILAVLLGMLLFFGVTSCKSADDAQSGVASGEQQSSSSEISSGEENSSEESSKEESSASEDSGEAQHEAVRMELLLISGDERKETSVTDAAAVADLYQFLTALTYEPVEDASMDEESISVYFYDASDAGIESFAIDRERLKCSGVPDTYRITSPDFDYDAFMERIKALID